MNKPFSDRGVVVPSLFLLTVIIGAALMHFANNAPNRDGRSPRWRSIEQQFLTQMSIAIQRSPKVDVGRTSKLRAITVQNIQFPVQGGKTLRIDYTLYYVPEGVFNYSCIFPEYPPGDYIAHVTYGKRAKQLGDQKAYISLTDPLT